MGKLNAWNESPDPASLAYHERQWGTVYSSTKAFSKFIEERVKDYTRIVDAGCGAGAATGYLAQQFPKTLFEGLDCAEPLLLIAKRHETPNLAFAKGDMENLPHYFGVDGVVSIQTLHILPDYKPALKSIVAKIRPRWIAFSTLICEGDIDCSIVINEHQRPRESFSNVYGLPGLKRFMQSMNYQCTKYQKFEIDIDLPKNSPDFMGTYTLMTGEGRLQCSGPLLFPWGFAMFERC